MYGWNNRRVALADLIAFACSAPMRELAARVGMSDVGLMKLLRSYGASGPPQGYWNRVHAGRPVPAPPAASARGPGQRPAIQRLLDQDEKEQAKAVANRWYTPAILHESPFDKRRLRILNAVFLTLARMGHHAPSDRDGNLTTFTVVIGDTRVSLTLDEATKKAVAYNCYDAPRPDPKRPASVPLRLTVGSSIWQDDGSEKLEARI